MKQPEAIGNLLREMLEKQGLAEKLEKGRIFAEWKEWVPESVANNTEPVKIKNGVLFVKVKDDAWRSELIYLKESLKNLINKKMRKKLIKDIKFM